MDAFNHSIAVDVGRNPIPGNQAEGEPRRSVMGAITEGMSTVIHPAVCQPIIDISDSQNDYAL